MLQTVIGVRFKRAGKIYTFSPGDLDIKKGDDVIVETSRGLEYGIVVTGPREAEDNGTVIKQVLRIANDEDRKKVADNKKHLIFVREKLLHMGCQ